MTTDKMDLSDEGLESLAVRTLAKDWLTEKYSDVHRLAALLRDVRDAARTEAPDATQS
jgi:hypothetical protein